MTRKESGWVQTAMEIAETAAREAYRAGDYADSSYRESSDAELRALRAHLTSLQSAAEGLEEALKLIRNHSSVSVHQIEIIDAALAAFQAIKEK